MYFIFLVYLNERNKSPNIRSFLFFSCFLCMRTVVFVMCEIKTYEINKWEWRKKKKKQHKNKNKRHDNSDSQLAICALLVETLSAILRDKFLLSFTGLLLFVRLFGFFLFVYLFSWFLCFVWNFRFGNFVNLWNLSIFDRNSNVAESIKANWI